MNTDRKGTARGGVGLRLLQRLSLGPYLLALPAPRRGRAPAPPAPTYSLRTESVAAAPARRASA